MSEHGANVFLNRRIEFIPDHTQPLSSVEALELSDLLRKDANRYYRSGIISYAEAISGVNRKTWSWSAVKFYYSAFYLVRALLALEGIAYVSIGKKLGWIRTVQGASFTSFPKKRSFTTDPHISKKNLSGSHGSVLYLLEENFPNSRLLSQEIEGVYPTEWLMRAREFHNYHACGFSDPLPSVFFSQHSIEGNDLPKLLKAYLADDDNLYTFSPDHAIIAYPTFILKHVASRFDNATSVAASQEPFEQEIAEASLEHEDCEDEDFIKMISDLIANISIPIESIKPFFMHALSVSLRGNQ